MITPEMCDHCWRPAVAKLTARRNTFWRTLLGRPRPTYLVCAVHLQGRTWMR